MVTDGVVDYRFTNQRSSSSVLHQPPSSSCSLMEVKIFNNDDSFTFPCFSCSGFITTADYHTDFRHRLTEAISNAVVLPAPHSAAPVVEDVLSSVLLPANDSQTGETHRVLILVFAPLRNDEYADDEEEDEEEDDVMNESFEEAGPQRKPCKTESMIEMIMARDELWDMKGDKAESDWKESGSHDCVICMEEIESVWDSLKPPCSHDFHEECLLRWFDENHVCPLCRFELPIEEDMIDRRIKM